jgi:hypothetical protein
MLKWVEGGEGSPFDTPVTNGGAISMSNGATVAICDSHFVACTATGESSGGGAIHMDGPGFGRTAKAMATISGALFERNEAGSYGGAIDMHNAMASITNTIFKQNYASIGGAIRMDTTSMVFIDATVFDRNQADFGGAICLVDAGTIASIKSTVFTRNSCIRSPFGAGGAIQMGEGTMASIIATFFDWNLAIQYNHLHATSAAEIYIYDVKFYPYLMDGTYQPGLATNQRTRGVVLDTLAGCNEWPCELGESCSYRRYSLLCTQCPGNTVGLDGRTCTTCCAGMGPSPDRTTCIPCVNSEYSPFGVCQNCTEGLRPNVDRTACLECPEGAAQTSTDGECACSAGYYNVGLFAEGAGTDESAGTSVPAPGVAPSRPPPPSISDPIIEPPVQGPDGGIYLGLQALNDERLGAGTGTAVGGAGGAEAGGEAAELTECGELCLIKCLRDVCVAAQMIPSAVCSVSLEVRRRVQRDSDDPIRPETTVADSDLLTISQSTSSFNTGAVRYRKLFKQTNSSSVSGYQQASWNA